jgi:hypothetical protein
MPVSGWSLVAKVGEVSLGLCVVERDEGKRGGLLHHSQHIYNFNWPITYTTFIYLCGKILFYMYVFHYSLNF